MRVFDLRSQSSAADTLSTTPGHKRVKHTRASDSSSDPVTLTATRALTSTYGHGELQSLCLVSDNGSLVAGQEGARGDAGYNMVRYVFSTQ